MDPAADALVRLRQGSEASVRFQIEHAGYFSLLDVERADAGHAELLREGGDVYFRDVLGAGARGAGRRSDRRRRAGAGAGPRRARRRVVVDPRLARRAHRPPAEDLAAFVGAWVARALGGASHLIRSRSPDPGGVRLRAGIARAPGQPAQIPAATTSLTRIVSRWPSGAAADSWRRPPSPALGPVLVIAPFCLLALFVIWLLVRLVWDVPFWWFAGGYALGAVLLFVRPIQALVLTPLFGARRPTDEELARLAPVWRDVARVNDLPADRYILRVLPSDEINAFACGGHLVVVTTFALAELPRRELAGVLAHELSHHLGLHTVGLTFGHWLSLPVVLLARIGFWLQNVATAATDTFARGSAGTDAARSARRRPALRPVAAVRGRPLRRRRVGQRRRPPLRVPGRPPRRAHGLRPQPVPRAAPRHRRRRRSPPRRLARPPRCVASPRPHPRRPHRRHAPPPRRPLDALSEPSDPAD